MAKPFVKWAGGKTQLLTQFENILPQNLNGEESFTYIEPFVGGGAMLFHMLQKYPNINRAIINDINSNLITTYRVIKEEPDNLISQLQHFQTEFRNLNKEEAKKEYFLTIRKSYNEDSHTDISLAAMFIFLNRTCFNGLYRVNSKGFFNVPFGKYSNPTICDEKLIIEDSKALQKVEILCGDYSQIEQFVNNNTFVYFDPPYRPISSTSRFTSYSKWSFDDNDQIRLAQFFDRLSERGCKMMLSNSDCEIKNPNDNFFQNLYGNFIIEKVYAPRYINSMASKRGKLTEILVRNYQSTIIHSNIQRTTRI